jgi:hypothetical protein
MQLTGRLDLLGSQGIYAQTGIYITLGQEILTGKK